MTSVKSLLALYLITICSQLISQEEWIKIYGEDRHNVCRELIETYDGGYLIGGHIKGNNGTDIDYGLLIKTDINGEVLWEKKIGGLPGPGKAAGSFVKQTSDGGLIVVGTSYLYDAWGDAFILKLNACGEKEWSKIFYNEYSSEYGVGIEIMDNGSFLAMIKYWGNDLGNDRIWLFNIDQDGETIWQKVYAKWTLGTNAEEGRHLIKNHQNEFLITGDYYQYNPGEDTNARYDRPMYIKIDSNGSEQWHLLWGENEYFYGFTGYSVFNQAGHIFSVGQNSCVEPPGYQGALFKIDENGKQVFTKNIPDSTYRGLSTTVSLLQDSVLFIGTCYADWEDNPHTTVYKTDTTGNILVEKELLQEFNTFNSSIISFDNKYVVTGSFYLNHSWDIYLWKFNRDLEYDSIYTQLRVYDSLCPYQIKSDTIDLDTTTVNLQELYEQMHQIQVYPNPAKSKITINLGDLANGTDLKLYNSNGQMLRQITVINNKKKYEFDLISLPAGIYLVVLENNGLIVDKKKVIIGN